MRRKLRIERQRYPIPKERRGVYKRKRTVVAIKETLADMHVGDSIIISYDHYNDLSVALTYWCKMAGYCGVEITSRRIEDGTAIRIWRKR